jgi:predicted Zn-dependent protease
VKEGVMIVPLPLASALNACLRFGKRAIALLLLACLIVQPAMAQSILRDAETEALFDEMSAPLISAAGLDPRNVKVVMIGDNSINAFVAGGQIVYIHSGLITAAANANEVQGVIAHELGHVAGGHVIRTSEGVKTATGITILSLILGAAAMAAGAGDVGAGIMAAGQQAAMGKFLAFSRSQESSADLAGADYLSKAGISGRGSIAFFKRLQNLEFRYGIPQTDSYERTHPLSGERIAVLQEVYDRDPAYSPILKHGFNGSRLSFRASSIPNAP